MEDFASLVEQHQQLVFRTLARLTGQGDHLEDLAQEVFLRLFRALPHFAGRARLSTFLYRVVVNVAKDEWARRRRARRIVFFDDVPEDRRDPAPDPERLWERNRFQAALEASLEKLSLRERTVLTLYFQEQRSYEDIAAILGAPMGTVKTQLHRARRRLKTAMREWFTPCKTIR